MIHPEMPEHLLMGPPGHSGWAGAPALRRLMDGRALAGSGGTTTATRFLSGAGDRRARPDVDRTVAKDEVVQSVRLLLGGGPIDQLGQEAGLVARLVPAAEPLTRSDLHDLLRGRWHQRVVLCRRASGDDRSRVLHFLYANRVDPELVAGDDSASGPTPTAQGGGGRPWGASELAVVDRPFGLFSGHRPRIGNAAGVFCSGVPSPEHQPRK